MDTATPSTSETDAKMQFTVDLGQVEMTDEEVNALQNQITKLAIECVRQKDSGAAVKKEPYPKVIITFVRSVHT